MRTIPWVHLPGQRAHVLWPAAMKPGLYHAALSRMGRLVRRALEDAESASAESAAVPTGASGAAGAQVGPGTLD